MKNISYIISIVIIATSANIIINCSSESPDLKKTAATPVFSLSAGTYNQDIEVSISSSTEKAEIYYTTDGTSPDDDSFEYSAPVQIAGHGTAITIKAIAVKSGMKNSAVANAQYIIDYDNVSTPQFSHTSGTYNTDIDVTITCLTASADIYYTVDGTTPSTTASLYTGTIPITGNGTGVTVKAIAVKGGMADSTVVSADYSIDYDYKAKYIDPSAGVTGDGSFAAPYKTWAEVTFEAGNSYRQKRGTIAREQITVDASGTAGNVITIGAYGTGADPIIQGSEIETGWSQVGATDIYEKTIGLTFGVDGFGMAVQDGGLLTHHTWDTDVTTTFASASAGSYSFDFDNKIIYVWCTDSASPDTHTMEVSRRYFGIHGDNVSYITIDGIHIRYVSLHGIVFAGDNITGSSNITVKNCTLEKLGGAVITTSPAIIQAGNGIEFGNSSSNGTVQGCALYDIFDSGISPQIYSNGHTASGFSFTDNTAARCGFAGVEIVILQNGTNSTMSDVTVENTDIFDCGTGWSGIRWGTEGRGIKVDADAGAGTISDVLIEHCTISDSAGSGIYIGGEPGVVTVKRCKIENNELDGIEVNSTGSTIGLNLSSSIIQRNGNNGGADDRRGVFYHCPNGQGFNIYHNTFYNNASTNTASLLIGAQAGSANLRNNIFHASSGGAHFATLYTLTDASIEYNFFTEFGAVVILAYDLNGTPVYDTTATGFNSSHPFASNNKGDTAPGLTDPENADFALQSTSSPCYHAGDNTTGITEDYAGIPFSDPPSIGAYEYP